MSIKSAADRRGLEAAATVVRITLDALAGAVRPGVTTAAHHEHTLVITRGEPVLLTAG